MWFQVELPEPATITECSSTRPAADSAAAGADGRNVPAAGAGQRRHPRRWCRPGPYPA